MKSLINRDELRRLEKAAREKDKTKLRDWALQYEATISAFVQEGYENIYKRELANSFDILMLALMYTLLKDDMVKIKKEHIEVVIDNFHKTIDGFRTGEYSSEDYLQQLRDLGITLSDYNYNQRLTEIVIFVLSDEYIDKKDAMFEHFNKKNYIVLTLDNFKGDEQQIRKNVDIINMCTKMYYLGESDIINTYIQYATQIGKPVVEAQFILTKDYLETEEINND